MKKMILSLLISSSLTFGAVEQMNVGLDWEKAVQVGVELSQDGEVIETVMKLHKAFLNFVEVILKKIASNCDAQEKAVAQVGLDYLAEIVNDPVVRSMIVAGDAEKLTEDDIVYLQGKITPLVALVQLYGPAVQQMIDDKFMVTKTQDYTSEDGASSTTVTESAFDPNNVYLKKGRLFILERIIELLDIARKRMK